MDTFGDLFKLKIYGESHSSKLGVIISGVPSGIPLSIDDFLPDLSRRKSGIKGTTSRNEEDMPIFLSGVSQGETTSESITIEFQNNDIRPADYSPFVNIPRPGHADFVSRKKYGIDHLSTGGGIFSGRMTLPLVAAGVVAKKIISPVKVSARLVRLAGVEVDGSPWNNKQFTEILDTTISEGDSVGGVVECQCLGIPAGYGNPFFDSVESVISHIIFSIPGVRGIEFGDGFAASEMKGSQHNDCFDNEYGHTITNHAGGINGGITNGNPIVFRVAFKPTSSITKIQHSFNFSTGKMEDFSIGGRHDACFALRTPVVVESAAACAICDMALKL